ncbi:hypothetical protein CANCADRAFT_455 [Tortispora caseinolytica NRRL Y-17796]|uniref:Uncharacterized protein n=1 Tax=Tortispora caseinolytica NRRL Y-17796 TaxID=767744 RepID=A0A1E4TJL9_9ASCO|nr:hypothetical protein CANCADRAFT_455 [Tortispora caseinolytica NRRL Y-17796]
MYDDLLQDMIDDINDKVSDPDYVDGLETSLINGVLWTAEEKHKFFKYLGRTRRVDLLAKKVGKAVDEVSEYMEVLEEALSQTDCSITYSDIPAAAEMSAEIVMEIERISATLSDNDDLAACTEADNPVNETLSNELTYLQYKHVGMLNDMQAQADSMSELEQLRFWKANCQINDLIDVSYLIRIATLIYFDYSSILASDLYEEKLYEEPKDDLIGISAAALKYIRMLVVRFTRDLVVESLNSAESIGDGYVSEYAVALALTRVGIPRSVKEVMKRLPSIPHLSWRAHNAVKDRGTYIEEVDKSLSGKAFPDVCKLYLRRERPWHVADNMKRTRFSKKMDDNITPLCMWYDPQTGHYIFDRDFNIDDPDDLVINSDDIDASQSDEDADTDDSFDEYDDDETAAHYLHVQECEFLEQLDAQMALQEEADIWNHLGKANSPVDVYIPEAEPDLYEFMKLTR